MLETKLFEILEDIDAIYFAKNIGLYPITTLINNYYENLVNNRKTIVINSIQENGKSLEDSIFDKFTGKEGIQLTIKGWGLVYFIYSTAGEILVKDYIEKNLDLLFEIYKLSCKAFANKIYSLKDGYIN
ncbi:MAG: hypothetical protein ACRCX8_15310 [Sarcina sp.]